MLTPTKRKPPRKPRTFTLYHGIHAYVYESYKNGYCIYLRGAILDQKSAATLSRWLEKAAEYVEYKNRG